MYMFMLTEKIVNRFGTNDTTYRRALKMEAGALFSDDILHFLNDYEDRLVE